MPGPKFHAPELSASQYHNMPSLEFEELCENLQKDRRNKVWMKEIAPDPNINWVLVVEGKPVKFGYSEIFPSAYQVREKARQHGGMAYLLKRPRKRYQDISLYFETKDAKKLNEILGRSREDITDYLKSIEGISQIDVQSGILNNLNDVFALGRMVVMKPMISEETYHAYGAIAAMVYNQTYDGKFLCICSQSKEEVNKRGAKTIDQREQGRWLRIERLHRFDDPILDIFDTYSMKKQGDWPILILYKSRKIS